MLGAFLEGLCNVSPLPGFQEAVKPHQFTTRMAVIIAGGNLTMRLKKKGVSTKERKATRWEFAGDAQRMRLGKNKICFLLPTKPSQTAPRKTMNGDTTRNSTLKCQ